ncbi:MAG: DUF885 domain-containing protein [Novosphingobium sp.]
MEAARLMRSLAWALLPVLAGPALIPSAARAAPAALPAIAPESLRDEDARLALLFAEDARREQDTDPLERIYRGELADPGAFSRLFTDEADRLSLAAVRESLAALARIDRKKLTPPRQLSYDVFLLDKRQELAWLQPQVRALTAVRPLNHFGGLQVEFPTLMAQGGAISYETESDYRRALALDAAFAHVLDQAVLRFREGMESGVVESRLTVTNMIAQVDALIALGVEGSPFYSPVKQLPARMPEPVKAQLRDSYARVVRDEILPAYRRLRAFLSDEYLPVARAQPGLSAMRGGGGIYRRLIERHTTLRLDPDLVHRLGLREVARIQREMEGVRAEMGFAGSLREFFDFIRKDPKFHPKTKAELAEGFAAIGKAVDAQIPKYFLRAPRTPLVIQSFPEYREKYEAGGSYNQGSPDGTRPGIFFYNAYDLPSRFLTGMTTLYLHEGAPGHHFQISRAQENASLPDFQRFGGNNAFVEGWALYAETLGYEMGFYKDPMQHWGTLDDEMLRAMRLVVDTGIHTKGWSREQAIDYMLANSGMGRTDATSEVERYIANPAQALSYKLGAMTIQRLRARAEKALGAKFDIRQFHEQVLDSGALPLPVLEAKIDRWIRSQARRSPS